MPVFLYAQEPSVAEREPFCEREIQIVSEIERQTIKTTDTLSAFWKNQVNLMEVRQKTRDREMQRVLTQADRTREGLYKTLRSSVSNDEEKNALQIFEQAVETAVRIRRASIDENTRLFRRDLESALLSRTGQTRIVIETFRTDLSNARTSILELCDAGEEERTVIAIRKKELEKARSRFSSSIDQVGSFATMLRERENMRREILRLSLDTFSSSIRSAAEEFNRILQDS